MTRSAPFAVLAGLLLAAASRADVEVAPPPREVRPDGTRDPAPVPKVPKAENPAETVGKIIKNSKTITERLAKSDTGTATRKTQDETLALIDSLLNREDDPPPQPSGSPEQKEQDQKSDSKQGEKKDDGSPSGGMQPMGGMQQPMAGGGQGGGRRPRAGSQPGESQAKQQPGEKGKEPMKDPGSGSQAKADPKKDDKTGAKEDPKGEAAGEPGGGPKGVPSRPSLPVDDVVVKEVWGHLPDRVRQQVTQYYKEQFMPKYADLLKQYYSSLAEKNMKPGGR
jgi:hypothetical protein